MKVSFIGTALVAISLTACATALAARPNAPSANPVQQTNPTATATLAVDAGEAITEPVPIPNMTTVTATLPTTDTMPMTDTMEMTDTISITDTAPMTDTMMITATEAMAEIQDADGNVVGTAMFTETGGSVEVSVQISGLMTATAGEHGIHIHQIGACTPDFAAAGAHYNPEKTKHGFDNPKGPHAGDLENITFDDAGAASYNTTTDLFTISGETSLLGADGSSIVIHANADDYVTDASGKSGGRIACGVLMAAGAEPMLPPSEPPPPPGGTLNSPAHRSATPENIASLQVPEGFTVTVFARGLDNVRMLAQAENGTIYTTRRSQGDVIMLRDDDGDGEAETFSVVAMDMPLVQGIHISGSTIHLGTPTTIYSGTLQEDGTIDALNPIVTGMPDAGQHANSMLGMGPDGNLYVTHGSSCNACNESTPEKAAMLQIAPDGSRTVFAEGLRNTLGWSWHPETGELWGMDHGSDWRGDDQPPEELNLIEQGNHYGWPHCYGDKQVDRYLSVPPVGQTKAEFCAASTAPVLNYQAHSAPIAMVFYTGDQFPEEYQNSAFVAMRGSWNRAEPTGYKVVWLRFEEGQPTEFADFLTGFLLEDEGAYFGRPAGLLVTQDGSLLVGDDSNGMVYAVRYEEE